MSDYNLKNSVAQLCQLIAAGKTLEAMEIFYDEAVEMQENDAPPRQGKPYCIEHEKQNLAGVSSMAARLLRQAIDLEQAVVFSEWEFVFTDHSGQCMQLTEVSVQQWQAGRVVREKFYYRGLVKI